MQIINFLGNPNIGLFFYSTDKFTIVPKITDNKTIEIIEKELKTKVFKIDIMNSSVDGIFLAGNEELLLVPKGISKDVLKELEALKIKIVIIDTTYNALGNNIIIYNKKALVNPNLEDYAVKQLEDLGLEVMKSKISSIETVGANLVIFNKRGLINKQARDNEIESIKEFFKIDIELGSVNNDSPIIKAGFVKNKNGILISKEMNGNEIMVLEDLMK
ncbi:MAG: translation initiation factor IF-6 [Candidatus Nanoarchaeia archaeon]|nr:translation initiation factor IF-6 [Candidatus Nanoarchaeia archaeon]